MKKLTSLPTNTAKILPLIIFVGLALAGLSRAEDVEFFEKRYETVILGVKPIEEYSDPDSYYTAIARKLGIFGKAYYAVFQKYGWTKGDNKSHSAKLTRAEGTGQWELMVVQVLIDPKTKKPDMGTLEMKLVFIDDDGKAHFPKPPKQNGKAEQGGARQPATAGDSNSEGSEKPKPESEGRSK